MRVIHVLDHSIPLATAYAEWTIQMLAQQRAIGWETFQLTGPNHDCGAATEEQVAEWLFYRTPRPGGILEDVPGLAAMEYMGEVAYRLERLARRVRPHILHAHPTVLNAIPALRVGRRLRIPVVYEMRPLDCVAPGTAAAAGRIRRGMSRVLETWVLRRADAITTVCDSLRVDMVVRGIPPAKVTVISSAAEAAVAPMPAAPAAQATDPSCGSLRARSAASYRDVYANLMGAV